MDKWHATMERLMRDHQPGEETGRYKCPKCRDTGWIYRTDENGLSSARRCECYAVMQTRKMMASSGISEAFLGKDFGNFKTKGDPQLVAAKQKAMQYVASFEGLERDRFNSIMFCGQVGAGKTHLGVAICGELAKKGVAVAYMAYRNAVTKLKQNVADEAGYNRELNRYTSARVLYIDDLLKGRLTEADVNILYEIVNYRYMNNKPVIISTEKTPTDLLNFDEAIGSRIWEMCSGNIIQLQGKRLNYRLS